MGLADLKKSISEMTTEELRINIQEVRKGRRTFIVEPKKTSKKSSPKTKQKKLEDLTDEELMELIKKKKEQA